MVCGVALPVLVGDAEDERHGGRLWWYRRCVWLKSCSDWRQLEKGVREWGEDKLFLFILSGF